MKNAQRALCAAALALALCGAAAGAPPLRLRKDGRVHAPNGRTLDCEVVAPEETPDGVRAWAAVEWDGRAGLCLFSPRGDAVGFLPLEAAGEFQGLIWSPRGDRLVLVRGSGVRMDMTFEVYVDMKKAAEIPGIRGEAAWLEDGVRLAMTRIDGWRDEGRFALLRLRLSAVLYDSAMDETFPLAEATDTQSFHFGGVDEEGRLIAIEEDYVEAPADWGDIEKVRDRSFTVPIPPAG